jgi:hypothetical protein
MSRVVCNFSAGAASAVAAKLAIAKYGTTHEIVIVRAWIAEEHEDNDRFHKDVEAWLGLHITVVKDEVYGASVREVWRRRRYINGPQGASCRKIVKGGPLDAFHRHDDIIILGYTAEEQGRFDGWIDANNEKRGEAPLIEAGLGKGDCLGMIQRAGIALPAMYGLGFNNNNCIGCCKGGEGYWNHVRKVFPIVFEDVAAIQRAIGPKASFFRNRETGERISLDQLDPAAGRHDEPMPECSLMCELAEAQIGGDS